MWFTGTATNHIDLFDKIFAHATAAGATIQLNETIDSDKQGIIELPGPNGNDKILTGIKTVSNNAGDIFNFSLYGFKAFNSGLTFDNQYGITMAPPRSLLWNSSIPYWLSVNERRVAGVFKVENTYQALYLGWINTNAFPNQYPYPMFVGGSNRNNDDRFSTTSNAHSNFLHPYYQSGSSSLVGYLPDGTQQIFGTNDYGTDNYHDDLRPLKTSSTSKYAFSPNIILKDEAEYYGHFDGIRIITGFGGISSEDTITKDSKTFTIFQNTNKTGFGDYFALENA